MAPPRSVGSAQRALKAAARVADAVVAVLTLKLVQYRVNAPAIELKTMAFQKRNPYGPRYNLRELGLAGPRKGDTRQEDPRTCDESS